ncbi:TNT domain-containing protein [Amycolatopsis sp. cg5]|uniref:TNT domain-containing protein n=1 Tax=Amycolatopsis sp. cg5 TaxID=3238802 RepID=UPI00352423D4
MRYLVEAAERPDGLYAVWGDRVFRAQRSTADGTLLLVTLPGEDVPAGFDVDWNGTQAKVVPESEASATFSLQTHCRYDDELYQVAPQAGEHELTLRWTGHDEARARELGLTDFSTTTAPENLTALWQTRHDFIETDEGRPKPGGEDQGSLLKQIGRTLVRELPTGWLRVAAQFRQVGDYAELEIRAVAEDDEGPMTVAIAAPPQLSTLFVRLRAAMYEPGTGTWFQGTFTLDSQSRFDFDYDPDTEPDWRQAPNEGGRPNQRFYVGELGNFPREQVPSWLAVHAGRPLNVTFRVAKPVDSHNEGERPVVNRPPVPPDAVRGVLDYLFRSPVVLSRPGPLPDVFSPNTPPDVPHAFHTDGTWIWPAAVPHYLRKGGIPPEPELVDHIRSQGFRPPYVSERLRATAEAHLLGQPYPPQTPDDLPSQDKLARGDEPDRDARAADLLDALHQRLAEHGVSDTAYRIGELVEGAWSLRKAEQGWEVSRPPSDEPTYFPRIEEAARFLLGTLLLYPVRAVAGAEEHDNPADWPILPLRGEPPLNFFSNKRLVVLPAGTTIQRFGNEAGNLVHPESARFVETSLAYDREREQRAYQVQRPLRVLTGITAPWNGMPGGAVAYVLPHPVGRHLESGALTRL